LHRRFEEATAEYDGVADCLEIGMNRTIWSVHRFSAWIGVGAMFLALLTAPLFHFHDRDDYGSPVSLVHAHFLESEESESYSHDEVEGPHSHHNVRWMDLFACKAPSATLDMAVDLSEKLSDPELEYREQVTIAATPQAHSPPYTNRSRPRSPPSI
jgi:hypothetical protein